MPAAEVKDYGLESITNLIVRRQYGEGRTIALNEDIDDMESMLEGYLAFARGEASEDAGKFELDVYFERLADEARLRDRDLTTRIVGEPEIHVRPHAFGRLLANVTGNAFRYARTVRIAAVHKELQDDAEDFCDTYESLLETLAYKAELDLRALTQLKDIMVDYRNDLGNGYLKAGFDGSVLREYR